MHEKSATIPSTRISSLTTAKFSVCIIDDQLEIETHQLAHRKAPLLH